MSRDGERLTDSGIQLPQPDGYPVAILTLDVPQVQISIVIPEGQDRDQFVEELTERICRKQLQVESGDVDAFTPLQMADPTMGDPFFLTPLGVRHVIGVGHGRAQKVDPLAGRTHKQLLAAPPGMPLPPPPAPRGPWRGRG